MDDDIQIVEEPGPSSSTVPVDPVEQQNPGPSKVAAQPAAPVPENLTVSNRSKRRWGKIAVALGRKKKARLSEDGRSESEEFTTFGLYSLTPIDADADANEDEPKWMTLKWDAEKANAATDITFPEIIVHMLSTTNIPLEVLTGFNNTGNVRIWPAEECLAWLVLTTPSITDMVKGKKVLELGCGMTALAAICASFSADFVVASDGSQISVDNAALVIERNNRLNCKAVRHLWGEDPTIPEMAVKSFDAIMAGDCFFDQEHHDAFIDSLDKYLKPDGNAIIVSPERSGALRNFIKKVEARKAFIVTDSDEVSSAVKAKINELLESKDERFDPEKHNTVDEHFAHTTANVMERVKEELKAKGLGDIEFPDDVLMRVAGVAQAVLVHKWGNRLEHIANHCKHTTITEEDVDLLFAHDPAFIAKVNGLADTYDDPVDELAVADKKPKASKPGSRESTKSPAAVRGVPDEDDDGDDEDDAGAVTSPEPVVKVAIGPKTVVRVPSFGESSGKACVPAVSPKPTSSVSSPFGKPQNQSPFNRSGPATPSRLVSPLVRPGVTPGAATTTPIVRQFPPQNAIRPGVSAASPRPLRAPQLQNPVRPSPLTSPSVQRFRPHSAFRPVTSVPQASASTSMPTASTPQRSPLTRTPFRAPVPPAPITRPPRPSPPRIPMAPTKPPQVQARLPFGNPVQRPSNLAQPQRPPPLPSPTTSQKSHDSWDDDIVFQDMTNLALVTPQAKKDQNNEDDGHDSFDDDVIFVDEPSAPSTSAASNKRPATPSNAVPNVKRLKSNAEIAQEFSFSDDDFDD